MRQVHCRLFPGGLPVISSTALTENEFLYAGNLMVASLLQGGPSPSFLATWVYEYIVSGDQGVNAVSIEEIPTGQIKDFAYQVKLNLFKLAFREFWGLLRPITHNS